MNACRELKVVEITERGQSESGMFSLVLENPGWSYHPGQFAMLRPKGFGLDPLWARPFSIACVGKQGIEFLIQKVGRGTRMLAALDPGDPVTTWGPLGNGFSTAPSKRTLILAGGVGLAPFIGYVASHPNPASLSLFLGHRQEIDSFPLEIFKEKGVAVETFRDTCPEDTICFAGMVAERVRDYAKGGLILACGPRPFLATVWREARAAGAEAQLSLENSMACGVGACLGCVTRDAKGGYVQTCTRGPIFWAGDVNMDEV